MMSNLITPHHLALEETDLQVMGGGECRPDPETRGGGGLGAVSTKFFFGPVWSKNKGGEGAPATALVFNYAAIVYSEIT